MAISLNTQQLYVVDSILVLGIFTNVIDLLTNMVTTTLSGTFNGVAANNLLNTVYFVDRFNNIVGVLDADTNLFVDTITGFFDPYSIAVNELTQRVYVADDNNVVEIDATTNSILNTML
ncbi:hypothetical protein LC087_09685 [Bacillus carboniphilus]|uniref:Uncharacterized protein n=1 Tax=Bacillus carboniphilus TaxID=86663 RepID=A0ABY9JP82_9BACI|nr:hypothetical protein [Bacillus carboniphilus]WLR41214.1 hypothetical protein LC087_09685 [Bacillus carboniphilus]